jgi:hypothetical protein
MGQIKKMAEADGYFEMTEEEQIQYAKEFNSSNVFEEANIFLDNPREQVIGALNKVFVGLCVGYFEEMSDSELVKEYLNLLDL